MALVKLTTRREERAEKNAVARFSSPHTCHTYDLLTFSLLLKVLLTLAITMGEST